MDTNKAYLNMINCSEYIELKQYYYQDTFMDILNVARDEKPHSAFIAWLLNPKSSHGLKDYPFRKILETVAFSRTKFYDEGDTFTDKKEFPNAPTNILDNQEYIKALIYGNYELSDIYVDNEVKIPKISNSNGRSFADIFVYSKIKIKNEEEKNFIFVIENKVKSSENTASGIQTDEYAKCLNDINNYKSIEPIRDVVFKKRNTLICYVFLNTYSKKEIENELLQIKNNNKKIKKNAIAESKCFCTLNYQYLLDGVLEPCFKECQTEPEKTRISEYIRVLGKSANELDNKELEKFTIMAISQKEKQLSKSLYDNHKDAVMSAFNYYLNENADKDKSLLIPLSNTLCEILNEEDENYKIIKDVSKSRNEKPIYECNGELYCSNGSRIKDIDKKPKPIKYLPIDAITKIITENGFTRKKVEEFREQLKEKTKPNYNAKEFIIIKGEETYEQENPYYKDEILVDGTYCKIANWWYGVDIDNIAGVLKKYDKSLSIKKNNKEVG